MVRVSAGDTVVTYDPATARLAVHRGSTDGDPLLAGRPTATLGDRTFPEPDAPSTVDAVCEGVRIVYGDAARTTLTIEPGDVGDAAVDLRLAVHGFDAGARGGLDAGDAGGAERRPGDGGDEHRDGDADEARKRTGGADGGGAAEGGVRLGDLRPIDAGATGFGAGTRVYEHGYQSWTPTGTLPVGERFPDERPATVPQLLDPAEGGALRPDVAAGAGEGSHDGDRTDVHGGSADGRRGRDDDPDGFGAGPGGGDAGPIRSSNALVGLLGGSVAPDGAGSTGDRPAGDLTLGFLDHRRFVTRFDLRDDPTGVAALAAVCPGDGIRLAPGERVETPALRIDATRPFPDALRALADAVAARMGARVPASAPTGWCSWYHYFTDVTPEAVRENRRGIDDWGVPLDVVQLDDGYQRAWGDWLAPDPAFAADGDGPAALADGIRTSGHTPGLWLAPFYVAADSELAAEHPEWLITEPGGGTGEGEPVDAGERGTAMYGLDTTHPGAEARLRETLRTVVDDWGFDYLKLDFLYAAALAGERYADVTRAEAYRHGLETIRETVGDDVFVLGCGAPGPQSVGLVDAMRVGPDTAPHWHPDGSYSEPAHANAVRNVLNRQPFHRRWWITDPDCQLLRPSTELTAAERGSFAAIVALSGGANVLSDAVAELGVGERDLFERTLPPVGADADPRVEGLGDRAVPARLVVRRPGAPGGAVAAFNWADEPRSVDVRVDGIAARLGIDGPVRVWDAWAGEPLAGGAAVAGTVDVTVEPHGSRVYHLAPALDRPHLLGARHLAGGAAEVTAVGWREDGAGGAAPTVAGTLRVAIEAPAAATLVLATPGAWRLHRDERPVVVDGDDGGEVIVRVELEPGETTLRFVR